METNIMGYILNLNELSPKAEGSQARIRAPHPSEFNMFIFQFPFWLQIWSLWMEVSDPRLGLWQDLKGTKEWIPIVAEFPR